MSDPRPPRRRPSLFGDLDSNASFERVLAAGTGGAVLIVAACLSGLPSATCGAMAAAIFGGVRRFGLAAVLGMIGWILFSFSGSPSQEYWGKRIIIMLMVGCYAWACGAGLGDIWKALDMCFHIGEL